MTHATTVVRDFLTAMKAQRVVDAESEVARAEAALKRAQDSLTHAKQARSNTALRATLQAKADEAWGFGAEAERGLDHQLAAYNRGQAEAFEAVIEMLKARP